MKKTSLLFAFIGLMLIGSSAFAQNFKYTAKASADCTNATISFTVPAGKTATIVSLDLIPVWLACPNNPSIPDENWAQVKKQKSAPGARNITYMVLYRKAVKPTGQMSELPAMDSVTLAAGTYILEVCSAPGAEATLTIKVL